jgi:hypothetical protein
MIKRKPGGDPCGIGPGGLTRSWCRRACAGSWLRPEDPANKPDPRLLRGGQSGPRYSFARRTLAADRVTLRMSNWESVRALGVRRRRLELSRGQMSCYDGVSRRG